MALKTEGQAPPPATFYELERLITRMSVPPLPVRTFSGMCGDLEMMDCISIWVVEEL
ncbi:MAG: hypothetical protein H6641_15690 [Caldilineaceae bacterium]|nr:hypothetical protein [Caldilineaceae bacterium]